MYFKFAYTWLCYWGLNFVTVLTSLLHVTLCCNIFFWLSSSGPWCPLETWMIVYSLNNITRGTGVKVTLFVWKSSYCMSLCVSMSVRETERANAKRARVGDMLLYPEEWGDSRLLKNWWVERGHVSPKTFPAVIHVLRDDFLSSISLHPAEVSWQRYLVCIRTSLYRAKTQCAWIWKRAACVCVFVKGMRGFYEDGAVNYSFRNGLLLVYNPIVNALLVSQLDSPVVHTINWEFISPFFILKCAL